MILKALGGGMLAAAGLMLGLGTAAELRKKLRLLTALDRALAFMSAEIEFSQRPLPDIFRALAESGPVETRGFFAFMRLESADESLPELWARATAGLMPDGESRMILESLGGVLGRYEGSRQAGEIESVRLGLQRRAEALRLRMEGRAKNYPALGLCAGALIAILAL